MTNLERWKKRFRNGGAKEYRWGVFLQLIRSANGRVEERWCLRAYGDDGVPPAWACPITMQTHLDDFPCMLGPHMLQIIAAADDAPHADRDLRAELLRMCDVEEP
jgi:hypothetical protein